MVVWIVNDQTIDGSETGTSFKQALYAMECGFRLHDTMIWYKGSSAFPNSNRYYPSFEYMFVFSKGEPRSVNLLKDRANRWAGTKVHGTHRQKDGTIKRKEFCNQKVYNEYGVRFNVWEIPCEKHNTTGHPAVFPISIARDHILTWSNKNDIVLDPFTGSGTTALAAYETQRRFIGFEISPEYYKAAKERLDRETAQVRMEF